MNFLGTFFLQSQKTFCQKNNQGSVKSNFYTSLEDELKKNIIEFWHLGTISSPEREQKLNRLNVEPTL